VEAELKLVKGDLHRVTQELQDRRQRVEKLEAKFAVVSTKKKSVYDEEEPKSQAYYVIKAAQQRQEMQARGDWLDSENHRLQKEVTPTAASMPSKVAMLLRVEGPRRGQRTVQVTTLERTLEQMVASNTAYNRSHKPVNEKRAFAERAKLRERLDKVYDRLKFKRQEERNLGGDVLQAQLRVQQLQHEQDALAHVVQELNRHKIEAQAAVDVRPAVHCLLGCPAFQTRLELVLYHGRSWRSALRYRCVSPAHGCCQPQIQLCMASMLAPSARRAHLRISSTMGAAGGGGKDR
jgi:coiled-coil domain-containing protein 39